MTDEDAFLAALKANPADDTARLVYADWLDERDQPQKAAYLRAVVDLTRLRGGTPEYTAAADRLYAACVDTAADWRAAAGARFDVVLESFADKVWAIKEVRERTGIGLGQSKALVESAPVAVFSCLPFEVALHHLTAFKPNSNYWMPPRQAFRISLRPTLWPLSSRRISKELTITLCVVPRQPTE
jgi:uncharacterized protein (TIGR02996 family)